MKKKIVFLLALSVLLITAATMNSTLAYFTSYAEARGGKVLDLSGGPNMTEQFDSWTKHLVITNDGQPVYVRAKAFAGNGYTLTYTGAGWVKGEEDDYYYYQGLEPNNPWSAVVQQGGETTELLISIGNIPTGDDLAEGDKFNVIVIYESTPVQYDPDGNPRADWTLTLEGGEG